MFGIGIIRIIISNQRLAISNHPPTLLRFKPVEVAEAKRDYHEGVLFSSSHYSKTLYYNITIYIHRTAINPTFFKSQNPNSIWFLFSAIHSSPGSYFFFFFYTLHLQSNFDILPNSTIFSVYRSSCTVRSKTNQFVYTREIHDFFF